jgi:hypothetical protein
MKKRGKEQKIVLAVISIIIIMTIFASVLILSGRTVLLTGNTLLMNPTTKEITRIEDNPCYLLRCDGWKQPILLGYEGMQTYNRYALCVCAQISKGEAFYDELQIKKIKTNR